MSQKRFLTADEVFQLFGVDSSALEKLVKSGEVQALADMGSFKYRSEDFAKLVQAGKLTARTAGELFQVDDKGEVPFLKLKKEEQGIRFNEDVSFLELDEEALNEQAQPPLKTPVVPEKWFDDDSDPSISATSSEIPVAEAQSEDSGERTDFDLPANRAVGVTPGSDSDVRSVEEDDMIKFDDADFARSGSDSDVQLEGPISSSRSQQKKPQLPSMGDSEIRLSSRVPSKPKSDSDVTIASDAQVPAMDAGAESDSNVSLAFPSAKKPDTDSDVKLAPDSGTEPADQGAAQAIESRDSDSDVVLIGAPDPVRSDRPKSSSIKIQSGDSGIRLEKPSSTAPTSSATSPDNPFADVLAAAPDSDLNLADSSIRFESAAGFKTGNTPTPGQPAGVSLPAADAAGSDIRMAVTEVDFSLEDVVKDMGAASGDKHGLDKTTIEGLDLVFPDDSDSDVKLAGAAAESGMKLFSPEPDSGITLETAAPDGSGINLDSGIALDLSNEERETTSPTIMEDSGITLEDSSSEANTSEPAEPAIDISFDHMQEDSGIRLEPMDAGSGISLETNSAESGIMLEQSDSGIRFESIGDSGISLTGADSGISLEDDIHATVADAHRPAFPEEPDDGTKTTDLGLPDVDIEDSAFDVNLEDSDHTKEMNFDEIEDSTPGNTVVSKDRPTKKTSNKSLNLSEAFQLDEPLEVQDLDISDDLDAAAMTDSDEELVAIEDDDVLEVSDDHFESGLVSVAEDVEEGIEESVEKSQAKSDFVATKARARISTEPSWGLVAVAPIICASVVMAVTMTVILGGLATMWTGAEVPAPAGSLISILAGISPF